MISVIVPVYNAAATLQHTVGSILAQNAELEVILVDDGSLDESAQLCGEIAASDQRVHVIYKSNGGPGTARNAGLDMASGEWIAFVDADDELAPGYFAELLACAQTTGAELVISDCLICNGASAHPFNFITPGKVYDSRDELWADFMASHISWSLWGRLYAARLWDELRFRPEDYIAEDLAANAAIYAREGLKVATCASTGYHYQEAAGSVDHSFTERHLRQYSVFKEVAAQAKALGYDPAVWYQERMLNCLKKAYSCRALTGAVRSETLRALSLYREQALRSSQCDRGLRLRIKLSQLGNLGYWLLMRV